MDVTVEESGPCRKVVQVRAPAEAVAAPYAETLKAFVSGANLPGFRRGKAPVKLVETRYATDIANETRDRLVPRLYREALRQEGIRPVGVLEVRDVRFDKASGLDFSVVVDVAPDFTLPDYKGIPIKDETVAVGDAQVDRALDDLRERLARFEPATDRGAQPNDLLRVDFDATRDGQPVEGLPAAERQLVEARDFLLYLGDPEFLPGINAALEGVMNGATREVDVSFPAEHPAKALAGQTLHYTVQVKELRARVLPEWTEEILKILNVESEAALRERVHTQLTEHARMNEESRRREAIARHLLERTTLELPQSVVEEETRRTTRMMVQDIARRGATREQIVEQQDHIVSAAAQTSEGRVKLGYILERIADEQQFTVTADDIEARLADMARRYEMPVERLRGELEKRDALDTLERDLRAEKTMAFLLGDAKIAS